MSKYTDFFPASAGTGFPFTGSGQMTGSLGTDVLLVEGGVGFRYQSEGTTAGWTSLGGGANLPYSPVFNMGWGKAYDAIAAQGQLGGTSVNTAASWDGTSWSGITGTPTVNSAGASWGASSTSGYIAGGISNSTSTIGWDGAAWNTLAAVPAAKFQGAGWGSPTDGSQTGGGSSGTYPAQATIISYNAIADTWTNPGQSLTTPRYATQGAGGSSSSGTVAGGFSSLQVNATEGWNGITFSTLNPLPVSADSSAGMTGVENNALFFGGETPSRVNTTYIWDGFNWSNTGHNMNNSIGRGRGVGSTNNSLQFGGRTTAAPTGQSATEEYNANTTPAGQYETFNYSEQTGITTVSYLIETSAERYKKDIQPLDTQVDKIKQLRPVQYNWKRDNRKDIGFIAEEVDKVYPQLVSREDGEISGMSYSKLAAAVVKTIQEQQDQIAKLNNELDNIQ